ncbi:MAG: hypothetical protein LWX07_13540, partial [Bacteroidetes bacterium]|nr:hypothetical protein [Bacteroidota bacterium]
MKKGILFSLVFILFANCLSYSQWNLMNLGGGSSGPIVCTKPGTFFVATSLGIYRSTNSTLTWQNVNDTVISSFWRSYPTWIAGRGDTVLYGSYGHVIGMARIYITTNNGANWRLVSTGSRVSSFVFKDECMYYSCTKLSNSGLYRSSDLGQTWIYLGRGNGGGSLASYGNYLYSSSVSSGTFRSSDKGVTWDSISPKGFTGIKLLGNLL